MLGIGMNLCIFYECVLCYALEKKSVQDCSATFGISCFLFIGMHFSFHFLMFPYIVIDFLFYACRDKVVDFHWNASDPWTIVSVSDDCESTGGGGTLQVINIFLNRGISISENL